jgi:predicted hydrocarbon binding protein
MKVSATREDVLGVLKTYKERVHVDFDSGQLKLGNLPIIWARAELQFNMYAEMENLIGEPASAVIRRMAKPYGASFCKLLHQGFLKDNRTPSRDEMFRDVCAENLAIGWGQIEIEERPGEITVRSKTGLPVGLEFASRKLKSERGVDSYFLGYFEGFLSALDNAPYHGEESLCRAKGDGECVLVFKKGLGGR